MGRSPRRVSKNLQRRRNTFGSTLGYSCRVLNPQAQYTDFIITLRTALTTHPIDACHADYDMFESWRTDLNAFIYIYSTCSKMTWIYENEDISCVKMTLTVKTVTEAKLREANSSGNLN